MKDIFTVMDEITADEAKNAPAPPVAAQPQDTKKAQYSPEPDNVPKPEPTPGNNDPEPTPGNNDPEPTPGNNDPEPTPAE